MANTLDLLRHGETVLGKAYLGSTDAPLTELGWQQMRDGLRDKQPKDYDLILTSPLKRCREFAEHWCAGSNYQVVDEIAEYHFGDWDGRSGEALYAEQPQALERFWSDPWGHPPPSAESMHEFVKRIEGAFEQWVVPQSGRILMICHGGVIAVLRAHIERRPKEEIFGLLPGHGTLHSFNW